MGFTKRDVRTLREDEAMLGKVAEETHRLGTRPDLPSGTAAKLRELAGEAAETKRKLKALTDGVEATERVDL
jgi:hypothetical protein